ncbi:tRNA threonylcarbamoyladenosine dehydratase [Sedimentibacter hydroxybenzoicus DSM 7310]|uniref:tRNA threonylcarbamoyladenosine dehydratase n=1 Tax=Sedimentibacter hydroxybenzoicus DSM 7310 TaxID=1123245 RepID=A0A974BI65_SEDHY|nr:tRNA threonylcarbamoyladenosine dehydratase [Sedimentibacter hydroxybenzoicus]NYB73316.1 tRNA threonylcarbamoyladenosine dehydratase [Sedimentibacter hydroxybenzoicus DSM 7310]
MINEFSRTQLLLGKEAMDKLKNARVAVFGIGGVGTFVVEGLARCGIGSFTLFDDDKVCLTNINRQLIATRKTIGKKKVDVMAERIMEINPKAAVETHACFYLPENADQFDFSEYDYIVDAIDTVSAKIELIVRAKAANVPIISSMGAGNKLNPTMLEVADIYKTSMDPLAKVMRNELKKRGIKKLKVVYSKEKPLTPIDEDNISCKDNCVCPPGTTRKCTHRRAIPGSVSFVPSVAGLIIASEVIKDIAID